MKRYKFLSAALLGAVLTMGTVTSCSDSGYLDINYNPNYPSTSSCFRLPKVLSWLSVVFISKLLVTSGASM